MLLLLCSCLPDVSAVQVTAREAPLASPLHGMRILPREAPRHIPLPKLAHFVPAVPFERQFDSCYTQGRSAWSGSVPVTIVIGRHPPLQYTKYIGSSGPEGLRQTITCSEPEALYTSNHARGTAGTPVPHSTCATAPKYCRGHAGGAGHAWGHPGA